MVWAGRGLKENWVPVPTIPSRFCSSLCAGIRFGVLLLLFFLNIYFIFWICLKADFTPPWDRFLGLQGWAGKSWVSLGVNLNIRTWKRDSCCYCPDGRKKSGKKGCVSWDVHAFSWNGVRKSVWALGANQPLPRNIPCPAPAADFHFGLF